MKTKTQKIVLASLFAAIICIATLVIKIPTPLKGYINLGDGMVLLAGWLLPLPYAFLASAIGSLLADVFLGYIIYAPATFIIKGLMAIVVQSCYKILSSKSHNVTACIISAFLAELLMVGGYYIFEGFLYGFAPSLVNIPANSIQALAGIVVGTVCVNVFKNHKIFK